MSRIPAAVVVSALVLAPASANAAWETQTIAGMDARVYTPSTVSKIGDGRGLLVVLHGCSQSVDALADFGNFEPAAEEFGWVVAVPGVPGGGVFAGCWDYYGPVHTRTSGHNGAVIELAETLRDDPTYDVDPAQVYLSGLSSGGGQAAVTGCLAPELFAGVGIVAGPAVGTTINDIATVASTGSQAAAVCQQLAGNSADLQTQLAIAYTDSTDFIVAQGYAEVHAQMYGELIGGSLDAMTETPVDVATLEGVSPTGVGAVYSDGTLDRVMWLKTDGAGHAWPAGSGDAGGGGLSFVAGTGVNFSYLMAEFFTANSVRADGEWTPSDSDDGGGETDGDGGSGDPTDGSDSGDGSSSGSGMASSGEAQMTDGAADGDPGADDYIEPSGCQCTARTVGQNPTPWLVLLVLLGRVRSRMRRRPANV